MCLLIVAETEFPSEAVLKIGEQQNGDGGGLAWVKDGLVHYKKNVKAAEMMEFAKLEPPFIFHFRKASSGPKKPELCHPFPISRKSELHLEGTTNIGVLAHNGHFPQYSGLLLNSLSPRTPLPEGDWSDTRAMAYLTALYGDSFLNLTDEKIAILTPTGVTVYAPHRWVTHGALKLSNDPFTGSATKFPGIDQTRWTDSSKFDHGYCD